MKNSAFSVAFVTLSLAILACGSTIDAAAPEQPASSNETLMVVSTSQPLATSGPTLSAPSLPAPAITESRRLVLEYPPKMRAGVESEIITLTLAMDDFGNITPTAQFEGNVVTGHVIEIPNLYETHKVTVEARLDLAGMEVSPSGATFEPLQPGKPASFYWSIRPQETGKYRGTAWLHLNFADKLSGEESRIAVSAQVVEIEAVDFFGLSSNVARTSGVIGSIVGGVIGFPFLEDILKFLLKKRRVR